MAVSAGALCRRSSVLNGPRGTASREAGGRDAGSAGGRDATIALTEQRAGSALHAMITDEHLTVSEAVQSCAAAISQREATRLRKLADTSRQLSQRII